MKHESSVPWAKPILWGNEAALVSDALASTWISGGSYVDRLESELADFLAVKHALAVCNGTAALHAAYLGLGIKPGDEIVVPGFAFMAAANIAMHMDAVPIFAEVDRETWCVTAESIERCLSPKTRLIVTVDSYGNVCDMDEIMALAKAKGIAVVEDAAEAFASRYKGRQAGTLATVGTFSFHATKTITTGEGGMVVTGDTTIADRIALYRSHGLLRKRHYWHDVAGHNFRLTNLQAALGCAQFAMRERIFAERKRVYELYCASLTSAPGITLQRLTPGVAPVMWAVAVYLDPRAYPQGRDSVMAEMEEQRIETRPGFYAASTMKHLYTCASLPVCEKLGRQVISLPTYPTLASEDVSSICNALKALRR